MEPLCTRQSQAVCHTTFFSLINATTSHAVPQPYVECLSSKPLARSSSFNLALSSTAPSSSATIIVAVLSIAAPTSCSRRKGSRHPSQSAKTQSTPSPCIIIQERSRCSMLAAGFRKTTYSSPCVRRLSSRCRANDAQMSASSASSSCCCSCCFSCCDAGCATAAAAVAAAAAAAPPFSPLSPPPPRPHSEGDGDLLRTPRALLQPILPRRRPRGPEGQNVAYESGARGRVQLVNSSQVGRPGDVVRLPIVEGADSQGPLTRRVWQALEMVCGGRRSPLGGLLVPVSSRAPPPDTTRGC